MKFLTQGLNPHLLCILHRQTSTLLVVPNILCGPKSELLFYHHVVRKWSPITQIWTYLSEGTASQISKHIVCALGAFHPFQDMPLNSMESKIVIFQKEIVRNRSRDMTWGPRGLDDLSSSKMQSQFCSCPEISLKRPAGARKISFLFVCLIWLEVITLQYCVGFWHTSTWTGHRHMCSSILNTPHTSLSTMSTQVVPEHCLLVPCLTHQFALVMYFTYGLVHISMISLKFSLHCLLPLSTKVCSLHLCLFCCPACRIIGIVFQNSIYICTYIYIYMYIHIYIYTVFVFLFLTCFTLYNRLRVHPPH